ncbi:hypothetical protein PFISCL1PPCAC_16458, partial [Pristionchus fissidentatus]
NNAALVAVEACLFSEMKDYCSTDDEIKFVPFTNWTKVNEMPASKVYKLRENSFRWNRAEPKSNAIQSFFKCAR